MNLDKILDNVFSSLKKVTPALFACAVFTGTILFLPVNYLQIFHLDKLNEKILSWMGVIFIASIAVIISIGLFELKNLLIRHHKVKTAEKELQKLTKKEKEIILIMYCSDGRCISMHPYDGIAGALIQKKMICMASNVSDDMGYMTFPYMLQPWVVNYISAHKEFIDIPQDELEKICKEHYRSLDPFANMY